MANDPKNGSLQITLWESHHTNLSKVQAIYLAKQVYYTEKCVTSKENLKILEYHFGESTNALYGKKYILKDEKR